ncbi:MAG: MBL fold metallo-hydrolase [Lentisphaeria bacterium]|nr:MBL fold metallo-hydrolase [Lentisphaeria bacterium]
MNCEIKILIDNTMPEPFVSEHGLSLSITYGKEKILFDTGAGSALLHNMTLAEVDPTQYTKLILSHGHYDHTGGLADILSLMPQVEVFFVQGVTDKRFSLHADRPVKELTMPEKCQMALREHRKCHTVTGFTEISDGIFLTGPIPRLSGEDCGGPFYLDPEGRKPDFIEDEQALLLDCGTLIQGCCHAGIINTVEYCKKCRPDIPVKRIIGGLHLLHATPERLLETRSYLRQLDLEELQTMHCTGVKNL